jgi:hypothetical protein
MVSTRTVEASSAHEATRSRSEAPVRASEIAVVLSLESPEDLCCAGSPARSPERRHLYRPGGKCVDCLCFRSSMGGASDRGQSAMTMSTKR